MMIYYREDFSTFQFSRITNTYIPDNFFLHRKSSGIPVKKPPAKKSPPPNTTGFQSREITTLNAPTSPTWFPLCGLGRKGAALSIVFTDTKQATTQDAH